MGRLRRLSLLVIIASATFPLVTEDTVAASYERCIQFYQNIQSSAYRERLKRDGAACKGYEKKYANDKGDITSDPCWGGPPTCKETRGIFDTRNECGEVASSKRGTPAQIRQADQIGAELIKNWNSICPMAQ
jgi:hypothetical protein